MPYGARLAEGWDLSLVMGCDVSPGMTDFALTHRFQSALLIIYLLVDLRIYAMHASSSEASIWAVSLHSNVNDTCDSRRQARSWKRNTFRSDWEIFCLTLLVFVNDWTCPLPMRSDNNHLSRHVYSSPHFDSRIRQEWKPAVTHIPPASLHRMCTRGSQ